MQLNFLISLLAVHWPLAALFWATRMVLRKRVREKEQYTFNNFARDRERKGGWREGGRQEEVGGFKRNCFWSGYPFECRRRDRDVLAA